MMAAIVMVHSTDRKASEDLRRAGGNIAPRGAASKPLRAAITLERLGLPACLLIAYLPPTMFWSDEMPISLHLFRMLLSIATAAVWFALGWEIYLLRPAIPIIALLIYLLGRTSHIAYVALGPGTAEGKMAMWLTLSLGLFLGVSVLGTLRYHRSAHVPRF
jgi:hypothetical protein